MNICSPVCVCQVCVAAAAELQGSCSGSAGAGGLGGRGLSDPRPRAENIREHR